jgi:hypothetical protein
MSDTYDVLPASADPFHHEDALRQEGLVEHEPAGLPDGVVAVVSDDVSQSISVGYAAAPVSNLGAFAAEAVEVHIEATGNPVPDPELPQLDDIALGGFLLFGAGRSSR